MARISSKLALTNHIKSQLGEPTIKVEVTNVQISEIIDLTVQKFTEYAYGTLEDVVMVEINGMGKYPMPDAMTNIIKLSKGAALGSSFNANFGSNYVPDLWSEQFFDSNGLTGGVVPAILGISSKRAALEKFFGDDIYYNFNHLSKELNVLENYTGRAIIHYQYEYLANDANDLVFNHEWVKAYAKAKTKELWGTVTGKFDQALVGGARINYDRLLQEAQMEIEKLDEQLLTKWSDPAPVSVM